METKQITITKVVSRNFIMDFVSKFQNMVGLNLTSYEKMIKTKLKEWLKKQHKENYEKYLDNKDEVWNAFLVDQVMFHERLKIFPKLIRGKCNCWFCNRSIKIK